tara:strand:+ start:1279 stop:1674 length:396 start_codon:yes stop_codon:yes gene_type:complete
MSDFPQFEASTPIVTPATSEVTYDKYWLSNLRIQAGDPTKPARLVAIWAPARDITIQVPSVDVDGNPVLDVDDNPVLEDLIYTELQPNGQPRRLVIPDLISSAEEDPATMGAAVFAVLTALKAKATKEGIL